MNKQNLINLIMRLKPLEELWLKDLLPDEQAWLHDKITKQEAIHGWVLTYNHSFFDGIPPTKITKHEIDNGTSKRWIRGRATPKS